MPDSGRVSPSEKGFKSVQLEKKEVKKDLTQGSIRGHLWRMAFPAGIGMLFNTLFNVVDTFWAGQLSTTALAALSLSFPIFFIVIALTEGLAIAASSLIAYFIGREEEEKARELGAQLVVYGVWAALFLTGLGLQVSSPICELLGAQGKYLEDALQYLTPIFGFSGFFVASSLLNGLLLARGEARVMRNGLIGGFFLNCILDPWFLFGGWGIPPMGVAGVAYATIVIKGLGCVYVWREVRKRRSLPQRSLGAYWPHWPSQWKIFTHALPASLNMMTIALGMFVTNYFIQGFGPQAVAAFGIGIRIEQIALLPTIGVYFSVLSVVGQNYGAKKMERVVLCLKEGMKISCVIMVLGGGVMWGFPQELMETFSLDGQVVAYGVEYLSIAALTACSYAITSICVSGLQAMHHPYYSIVMGVVRQFLGRVGLFYIVLHHSPWGWKGMWWALFALNWFAAAITLSYTVWVVHKKTLQNKLEGTSSGALTG